MAQLAEIAPASGNPIFPDSDLIDDLGFDEAAFSRLSMLLYRVYGIGGLSVSSMRHEQHVTVEGFFRCCVLEVLGLVLDEQKISKMA